MTSLEYIEYRFGGLAGEMQEARRSAALLKELGREYARYHAELEEAAIEAQERPEPESFDGDFMAYCAANKRRHDIVAAEVLLRFAYLLETEGKEAARDVFLVGPLSAAGERLVDLEEAKRIKPTVDDRTDTRAKELRRSAGGVAPPEETPGE